MASQSTARPTAHKAERLRPRAALTVTLTAAGAVTGALAFPGFAQADPAPTFDQVKQQVDQLKEQAEQAAEAMDQANSEVAQLQKKVDALQDKVVAEQAEYAETQTLLGSMASAQYRDGALDPTLQLMLTSHPDAFLQQASTIGRMNADQADRLKAAAEAFRRMAADKASAATVMTQLAGRRDAAGAAKQQLDDKLRAAQALLNKMSAAQRAQYEKANAATKVSASQLAGVPAVDGRAGLAVAFARAQLGKPYKYGYAGPAMFDCSGLTMRAWQAASVNLEHGSRAQYAATAKVTFSQLQPGDLIYFYSDLHHVAIYVGNNVFIHAPNSHSVVEYGTLNAGGTSGDGMPVTGFSRP
jgi:cell wall-associated NlpC family hydrolase